MNKNTLKSIGAVVAGFVAVLVLSLGTDVMMHAAGVFPQLGQPMSDALFLLATLYRTVYCIAGSYVAARLAPIGLWGTPWRLVLWALSSVLWAPW